MIFRNEYRDGVWVDLEQPTPEEIQDVSKEFSITDRIERELLSPTPTPLTAGDEVMALLVLHFPTKGMVDGETKNQEIDFVVGKHFIITVRYEIVAPLHHLKKLLEMQQMVDGKAAVTTETLLEILFAHLYASMRDNTNHIAEKLSRVEKEMSEGHEERTVRAISDINREFLHIEATLSNQEDALRNYLEALSGFGYFGKTFASRMTRILGERAHVARNVRTHREMATELRETNRALIESRQNSIMRTLTVINFIVMPLELIAFIYTMHAPGTPFEYHPQAFWMLIGLMLTVGIILTSILAKKRWIF